VGLGQLLGRGRLIVQVGGIAAGPDVPRLVDLHEMHLTGDEPLVTVGAAAGVLHVLL